MTLKKAKRIKHKQTNEAPPWCTGESQKTMMGTGQLEEHGHLLGSSSLKRFLQ